MTQEIIHSDCNEAHLPRADRRYPYKPLTPAEAAEVAAEVGSILHGVERMLYGAARKRLGNDAAVDDVVQHTRLHLWQTALPKYDAHRVPRVKVSTFIYRCANNIMRDEIRALKARRRRTPDSFTSSGIDASRGCGAADDRLDRKVEALAADVLENPERYLRGPEQCAAFRAVTSAPTGMPIKEIARRLGYKRSSSLSTIMHRIRKRIAEIDIEDEEIGSDTRQLAAA